MNRYKVCVYAICRNEEQFVDRWMDSMGEADQIVATDTGSEDGTVEKLRARGAVVYVESVKPWRFDAARNRSLDHVPQYADICVCTDLDEVFEPGWRKKLERAWMPETTMGRYLYNWSLKADGTPDIQFRYFKVHARDGYRWKYPIHEILTYVGKGSPREVFIPEMVLNHYPDPSKSRGSYLPLLELAVSENPQDDRMAYYLGREYLFRGRWADCVRTLTDYLRLPSATWEDERSAAMRALAEASRRLGRTEDAYGWYYRAAAETPGMREPYVECGKMAYELGDWPVVFYMMEEALKIKDRSAAYVNVGYAWDSTPDDICAIACYRLGMYERAREHTLAALAFSPEDPRLRNNLRLIEEKLNA